MQEARGIYIEQRRIFPAPPLLGPAGARSYGSACGAWAVVPGRDGIGRHGRRQRGMALERTEHSAPFPGTLGREAAMTAYTVDRLTKGAGRRAPRLRRPSHPLFYAACIWAATHASGTTTVYVDGGADAGGTGAADRPLASISAAVGRATSGDRILVAPGRYLENVVLQTEGLILAARDARRPELRSPTAGRPALTIEADRCTAKHLRFSGGQGVVIRASYTTVRNCTFERSSEPLQAWGRCHTITFCDVRNCAGPPQGGLFRVAGRPSRKVHFPFKKFRRS